MYRDLPMTDDQWRAFSSPLIGRESESVSAWQQFPWAFALTFNR